MSVTGDIKGRGFVDAENSSGKGFRLIDSRLDLVDGQSYQIQDWPVRVVDKDGRTAAMVKYYNNSDGSSAIVLADVSYSSEDDQSGNWAQVTIGHKAGGTPFLETALPTSLKGGLAVSGGDLTVAGAATFTNGLTVSGARAIFNHDIDANGALSVTKTLTAKGALNVQGASSFNDDITLIGSFGFNGQLRPNTNNWINQTLTGVNVGDESRPSSKNVIVWRVAGENGGAIMSEELYLNTDGSRDLRFNGRNRENTSWRLFLTIKEFANKEVRIIAADTPDGSLTDHTLVTAKWVTDRAFAKNSNVVHTYGDETISGNKTFNSPPLVIGSTGFEQKRQDADGAAKPSSDQQNWIIRLKDCENRAIGLIKNYRYADGRSALQLSDIDYKKTDSGDWATLLIGHRSDGTRFMEGVTPPDDSNGIDLVTTEWLRAYCWGASRGQIVHTVNNETISGTKTFNSSIYVAANPLIQSTPWPNIGIADTSRSATSNKMIAGINDKDGKRYVALEVTAGTDGSRQFSFNGRRRDDTGWVTFLRCIEYADGTHNLTAGQHPPAGDDSLRLATTGWVMDNLATAIPAGAVMYFAQGTVPEGWLFCNGSAVSRTTYAALYAAIGTKYGSGNGSSTFTLPNLRSIFVQGASSTSDVGTTVAAGLPNITGQITSYELGRAGGAAAGALYDDGSAKYGVSRDSGSGNHDGQSLVITVLNKLSIYTQICLNI